MLGDGAHDVAVADEPDDALAPIDDGKAAGTPSSISCAVTSSSGLCGIPASVSVALHDVTDGFLCDSYASFLADCTLTMANTSATAETSAQAPYAA